MNESGKPQGRTLIMRLLVAENHRAIGFRFLLIALIVALALFAMSLYARLELMKPGLQYMCFDVLSTVATGECEDRAFFLNILLTGQSILALFFVVLPTLIGALGNYLVFAVIGARNPMRPRLGNLSYWLYLAGSVILCVLIAMAFFGDGSANLGRGLLFVAIGLASLSLVVALAMMILANFGNRQRGLTVQRSALLIWSIVSAVCFVLLLLPLFAGALSMMLTANNFGDGFFDPASGGDPLLYQHLLWFYGQPESWLIALTGLCVIFFVGGIAIFLIAKLLQSNRLFYWVMVALILLIGSMASFNWLWRIAVVGVAF